jgi:CubicO group peptidase (beta-lactamase class C family)
MSEELRRLRAIDDCLAFTHALTQGRLLSSASLQAMTRDQLSPQQMQGALLSPGYFDAHGWGFGVGVATRDVSAAEPAGTYGWDGGLGTTWRTLPRQGSTLIMLSQRTFDSPEPPAHIRAFLQLGAATVA